MKLNVWIVSALATLTAVTVMAQDAPPASAAPAKKGSSGMKRVVLDPPAAAIVKSANVNLRGKAAFTGETLGHLQKGDAVTVLGHITLTHPKKDEPKFADLFFKFLLARSMRTQADLVDQLFNSSEKRLARILLLMAEFGKPGERDTFIPPVSQETLAEMIGTTRSRVSFFMNRFRKMGFINYNGRIQVNKSLLNVILLDQFPEHNSQKPAIPERGASGG